MKIPLHAQHGPYAHHADPREAPMRCSATDRRDDSLFYHLLDGFCVHLASLTQLDEADLAVFLEELARQNFAFRIAHGNQAPMLARGLNAICSSISL